MEIDDKTKECIVSNSPQRTETKLHDGSTLEISIYGEGPNLLLPVNPHPIEGQQAEELRKYGADPALGQSLIKGLSDVFRVIAFDYEGHVFRTPKPLTLTPTNVISDLLSIADAAQADSFAYYGYSWLAMIGIQLAIHSKRLSALMIGGYPPLDGPYKEMLKVATASYDIATGATPSPNDEWSQGGGLSEGQTQQFVTLYQALQGFDDRAAQPQITCPRLCFVGSEDNIEYGKGWGDVYVNLATPIIRTQAELEKLGWDVRILTGLNHMTAMLSTQVLPIIRPWLISKLLSA
jgi:pimeloyl-ACP methyl ester carboxylesterase